MNAPHVRLARLADFAAIAAITNHYIRHTAIHFGYADVSAEELVQLWQEHRDLYPWLVAVAPDGAADGAAGELIGYAKAGPFRARSAYRWTTETGIYLAPAHCGRGYGRPLYERLLTLLCAQGFHSAIGGIALPNDTSVKLHERLGFVHCGTIERAGRKFDRWYSVGFWQLFFHADGDAAPSQLATPEEADAAIDRASR